MELMNVIDALIMRDKLIMECSNLQKLEKLFENDKYLAETVCKEAGCDTMSVYSLIVEARMRYSELISDFENIIGNIEI